MQNQEDAQLLQRAKTDKHIGLTELYEKYFHIICFIAYDILEDTDEANNIAKEVLLHFLEIIDSIEINVSLYAYLAASVRYSCLNKIKKDSKHRIISTDAIEIVSDPTDYYALKEEQFKVVDEAVKKLPKKIRRTVEMLYYNGYTIDQIAAKTGLSKHTILAQQQSGLKKIRSEVKNISRKTN